MNRYIFYFLLSTIIFSQFKTPVEISSEIIGNVRAGEIVEISITAEMDEEWYIYALRDQGQGPTASRVTLSGNFIDEIGKVIESDPLSKYDENFATNTRIHQGGANFIAPFRLKQDILPGSYIVKTSILYQVCNKSVCYPPKEEFMDVAFTVEEGSIRDDRSEMVTTDKAIYDSSGNINLEAAIGSGLFSFIILSVSMGFLALLTPCVFPMIPITISFFTHKGEKNEGSPLKNAFIYTFGIIATFSIIGLLLALTLGASGANQLASNPWVNLFLASLFVYFSLSLFGMYDIQLPQWLTNLSLKQEGRGGTLGTIFMAVTFTLTSFTCTVQFVGLLLVAASNGQWFWPMLGMVIFSTAFASPFFFLALFPQYLSKMPKSGSWLNSVKVVLGFMEMAAAFKFISNSDLVWNWGFFTQNVVLASWAILMLLCGLYLLGKIQLPHDSELKFISVPRLMLSMIFLTFGLYLTSGMFGNRISGLIYSYLPPKVDGEVSSSSSTMNDSELSWLKNLDDAFVESRATGKAIFVDFTGYTCTNCRWMEANIFVQKDVKERFSEMVLVQLYTDGGPNHRENQQYEIERFGTAALPFYVILSPDDQVLGTFPGMSRNVDDFLDFLDNGLAG